MFENNLECSPDLQLAEGYGDGLFSVLEHAVGGRDDVLGGHQSPAADKTSVGTHESHHPGVLVHRGHLSPAHDPGCPLRPALAG